ncbi:hypothetical protein [Paractinoplanes atraurantiacus]|uniref:Uncharacterized protein n=1 Tax=Paractinoplanes atraurantiacus TaxID=1036182 RepID=A0A285GZG8_9ACTN|nr:hypothetical protein [Actinoplanes atraurantiacus]SNY28969.1 hypothetical protein SAMN05421748_103167 [Actinoplanes atraurantiacus]
MTVIQPNVLLHDARGGQWRPAPSYQDREPNGPGWLLLRRSADGVEMPYGRVLAAFGYGTNENRYLLGRFDNGVQLRATAEAFRCICNPDDLFRPPNPIPRAVEGCPAHKARYAAQQFADREQDREMRQSMNADGEL